MESSEKLEELDQSRLSRASDMFSYFSSIILSLFPNNSSISLLLSSDNAFQGESIMIA